MKKARKFIIGGITLAVTVLAGALIRTPTSIDYRGQIVEYSTVDSEISIEHEIVIEGIYYDSSLNYDSFQGTFYISDIGGIEKNRNNAHFNFNPKYRYCPEFQNDYGEPISSNIAQILIAQTKNTKELNEKIDKYIEKNETEHKKFDYEIADTRMKIKFAR